MSDIDDLQHDLDSVIDHNIELQKTIRTQQAEIERLKSQRDRLVIESGRLNEYYLDCLLETKGTGSPDPNKDADYLRVKAIIAEIEAEIT